MNHRSLLLGLCISGAAALALGSAPSVRADDKVDCSSLNHYDTSTTYKKGDVVWGRHENASDHYRLKFKCIKDTCKGLPVPENNPDWKAVATCSSLDHDPN